eukprot:6183608-Pleurochrysis_carterae.AAC.4
MLSKLAGRFLRPDHATSTVGQGEGMSEADAAARLDRTAATGSTQPAQKEDLPLPLVNNLTGLNSSTGARQTARSQQQVKASVREMPILAPEVERGSSYFIAIPDFEGELRVGIGRREDENGVEADRVLVAWLQRTGWSNDPGRRDFRWSGTPKLVVARRGLLQRAAPMRNPEPLSSFLPVPVKLTCAST